MNKKSLAVLVILVMAAIFGAQAVASQNANDEIFADEGPVTQADIDAYVAVWPKMMSPTNLTPPPVLFQEYGINDLRGAYLTTKIGNAYAINVQPDQAEDLMSQMPQILIPSQAEIDLVGKNMEALNHIYGYGYQAM